MTRLNLTPNQDTVLLHFFNAQGGVSKISREAALSYVVQSTNKLPSVIKTTFDQLRKLELIQQDKWIEDQIEYLSLTPKGFNYLKEAGWTLDAAKDNFREHVAKPKAKKARKPKADRADKAPAGLPSDADAETLRTNREEMSKPRAAGSHANCDHEATKPARSKCRKARAAAASN